MKKSDVAILIPVYKTTFNLFERISLTQTLKILREYPIYLIVPENMEGNEFKGLNQAVYLKRFSDSFFVDKSTYSKLCLSEDFYICFKSYQYVLICQLDAFVFRDNLMEFCLMNYDYIGAPTNHDYIGCSVVGNGGLSLRKIKSVLRIIREKERIMKESGFREIFERAEDNFFSYCGRNKKIEFTVPNRKVASRFAVQRDVSHGLRDVYKEGIPFGIHYFPSLNYLFWKPVIESYGYELPSVEEVDYIDSVGEEMNMRYMMCFPRLLKYLSEENKESFRNDLGLIDKNKYILWGIGKKGKELLRILVNLSINIVGIYDRNEKNLTNKKIPIINPLNDSVTNDVIIIIGTKLYENSITEELKGFGYNEKQYILYSDIIQRIIEVREKYRMAFPQIRGITKRISAFS